MSENKELKGLGGWLILVGIGVVISPFRLLAFFIPMYGPIFSDGTWEVLTTVGSEAYHPLWAPFLIGEITYNVLMIAVSIWLIFLFFNKHYLFPKVFMGVLLVSLVVIPLDAWLVTRILPDEPMFDSFTTREFLRSLIGAMIWVPYMLVSRRVKATFVRQSPEPGIQPAVERVG